MSTSQRSQMSVWYEIAMAARERQKFAQHLRGDRPNRNRSIADRASRALWRAGEMRILASINITCKLRVRDICPAAGFGR